MSDLISIIIPVFNAERTLERCLDSVLAQTHKEIEVICVNDCSRDLSADILSRYRDMDPRVIVLGTGSESCPGDQMNSSNTGCGPATARNAGLDAATGNYIGFVDADDFIDPMMYERLLDCFACGASRNDKEGSAPRNDETKVIANRENCEADRRGKQSGVTVQLANCGRISFFTDGTEKPVIPEIEGAYLVDNAASLGRLITEVPDFIWDKLFDAEIIRKEDIRFPDGRVFGEDTVFLIKYLCHVKQAVFISDPLYHYDAHSEGSITNTISDRWYDIFENLKDIIYSLKERMSDGDYKEVKPYLEELCIRYYDRRANAMIRHSERGFQYRYVKYSFEFLTYNFPAWKKRMKAMPGILFPKVKTSLLLMRFYILAPGFLKDRLAEKERK